MLRYFPRKEILTTEIMPCMEDDTHLFQEKIKQREVTFPQNFVFGERPTATFPATLKSCRSQSPRSYDQRSPAPRNMIACVTVSRTSAHALHSSSRIQSPLKARSNDKCWTVQHVGCMLDSATCWKLGGGQTIPNIHSPFSCYGRNF